jgi:hypothetical protein
MCAREFRFAPRLTQFTEGISVEQTSKPTGRHTRILLKLPIRVLCRESNEYHWTEQSRLVDVSRFGAGFTLTRPVEVGRLIQVTMPLPYQLRSFDHTEPKYAVWSLVRHLSAIQRAPLQESALFRLGVGFIGKRPPAGYERDPTLRYEPINSGESSMWQLRVCRPAGQRRESRLLIPLEVMVETLGENGNPVRQEFTVTETLSSLGACIPTNLDVGVGHILKVSSVIDQVSIFAVIRSRKTARNGITRLGLEFVGERWPLQRD